ncbi:hypothetical protein EIM20_27800 [Pseudomonas aeruginosa]|nr:hypothetical protein EIM20_27800 [Pseudomonas aeruginosa]
MKKYILLFASLILMITLASCSNTNPKQKKTTKKDEMKVGEMMQEDKEHVWFIGREDEPLDSNTKIDRYIITKNGQMKVYVAERIPAQKLGDLLKKDEKSLIKDIKNQDETFFKFDVGDIVAKTNADIENAKDLKKEGYEKYNPSEDSHGGTDYAVIEKELKNQSPEESLKKLEKYKKDVDGLPYKAPKSQKVDLRSVGSGELEISIARNYGYPKIIGSGSDVDNSKTLSFTNTQNPKSIGDKKVAGLSNYDEDSEEGTSPYLVTIVDDKIKKVSLDKPSDPAIKDNQKFKHKKGS